MMYIDDIGQTYEDDSSFKEEFRKKVWILFNNQERITALKAKYQENTPIGSTKGLPY